jgi:hypothetical protein
MDSHSVTIGPHVHSSGFYVECSCSFLVTDLSSREAAHDTAAWHLGEPSALGAHDEESDA